MGQVSIAATNDLKLLVQENRGYTSCNTQKKTSNGVGSSEAEAQPLNPDRVNFLSRKFK
jgi:hypothetical protein